MLSLLQPCASVGADPAAVPSGSEARCWALADQDLLQGADLDELVADARAQLRAYGLVPEQDFTQHVLNTFQAPQSVVITNANAYGRFSVTDNICDFSFAAVDASGSPAPAAQSALAQVFGTGSGLPPTAGIQLIDNKTDLMDRISSPDQNLAGHLCLRNLFTGHSPEARRVAEGIGEIESDPREIKVPALIVQGRADATVSVNHGSRPYLAIAMGQAEKTGKPENLHYVEVLHAHHFDPFNGIFPAYMIRYVGLHYYFTQALDGMYHHLRDGTPLPGDQVVPTIPRAQAADPLELANLPAMKVAGEVAEDCRIKLEGHTLVMPDHCQ
jgi:hydroxybutyrate-dimer hydrolase